MSAWAFSASLDRCSRFLNCPSARALASSDLSAICFVPPSAACLSVAPGRPVINTLDREADDEQEEVRGHAALQILARRYRCYLTLPRVRLTASYVAADK